MRMPLSLIPGFTLLLFSQLIWANNAWQQPDFILEAFAEVALKNEYSTHSGKVRKWQKPLKVWIDHRVGDQALHEKLVLMHISHLSEITNHPISLTQQKNNANVHLIFTRFEDMQTFIRNQSGNEADKLLYSTLCLAQIQTHNNEAIHTARIIIPVDQARMHGKLVSCIVEEITQIMGLINDSEKAYPSIFNDKTPNELLSGLDYLLLRVLYDERISPGMNRNTVMAKARLILSELAIEGVIKNATKSVSKGKLYELMGYR